MLCQWSLRNAPDPLADGASAYEKRILCSVLTVQGDFYEHRMLISPPSPKIRLDYITFWSQDVALFFLKKGLCVTCELWLDWLLTGR